MSATDRAHETNSFVRMKLHKITHIYHLHTWIVQCLYIYICPQIHILIHRFLCMYIFLCVYVCVSIHINLTLKVKMNVYSDIHVYAHTHNIGINLLHIYYIHTQIFNMDTHMISQLPVIYYYPLFYPAYFPLRMASFFYQV